MATRILQRLSNTAPFHRWTLPPTLATHNSGGLNLEIFKFGMYIMFPIGWMYYFGVNLETRFSVPDFWPAEGTTHRIPYEKEELKELAEQLKAARLERRRRRLESEKGVRGGAEEEHAVMEQLKAARLEKGRRRRLEREMGLKGGGEGEAGVAELRGEQPAGVEQRPLAAEPGETFGAGSIEKWASGKRSD